jgi:hypothetical protein
MVKKSLMVFPIFLLLLATAFPQGRGGGKGGGQGQGMGQGQGRGKGGGQSANGTMDRERIHATQQQQDQIRSCDNLADGIRKQARKMAKNAGNNFNTDRLTQEQAQIRDQVRQMDQQHAQLINGLDATQQQAWQEPIHNMNQLRQQMNLHQQQMEDELKGNPDAKRVAERAREMERTMNDWRKQYGALASQTE